MKTCKWSRIVFFIGLFFCLVGFSNHVLAIEVSPNVKNGKVKKVLVVGGGSSHDYDKWYKEADLALLNSLEGISAIYTDNTDSIQYYIKGVDLLILSNNQPITEKSQQAIEKFVSKGKPLVLLHAALWYNWQDWPLYNRVFVGGGSTSHEDFQEFKNRVVNPGHPITQGVSSQFSFKDELYRYVPDSESKGIEVLVIGQSLETDEIYPVVFTVKHPKSRIVGITLGHDGDSHLNDDYKKLVVNAVKWTLNK